MGQIHYKQRETNPKTGGSSGKGILVRETKGLEQLPAVTALGDPRKGRGGISWLLQGSAAPKGRS